MKYLCLDDPVLYLDAASVASHVVRLSGPAPTDPPAGFETGTEKWEGPYGTPVDQWTDAEHNPWGDVGIDYTWPTTPNESWLLDSRIPDGWYTVIDSEKDRRS